MRPSSASRPEPMPRISRRPEVRFLVLFVVILALLFTVVAVRQVNDAIVVPYTAFIARISGAVLSVFGEQITVSGCDLHSPRFAVTIYNGCNGLITSLIVLSGILAFPAPRRKKLVGILAGLSIIQLVNLIRIVSLYYIGALMPEYFNASHIVVWQSLVILAGVVLWIVWARWAAATGKTAP